MAVLLSLLAVAATFGGGWLALKQRDRMHIVLGLSGGLLLGLVAFDLIPEVFATPHVKVGGIAGGAIAFVAGFLVLHVVERASGSHEPADSDYGHGHQHHHPVTGTIGVGALVLHVFLDGLAVGVAFHVSSALGLAVTIAIVTHAFSDGLNTVALLVNSGRFTRRAILLLFADGAARVLGAALGGVWSINETFVTLYLALFAGVLTYLATSHILPEAHSEHPSRPTLIATICGVVAMFFIVSGGAHV